MERKYQIVLYGATGFTGRLCAEYFQSNYPDLNWAISGRNKQKLEDLKEELNTIKKYELIDLSKTYSETFFDTKKILYIPNPYNHMDI